MTAGRGDGSSVAAGVVGTPRPRTLALAAVAVAAVAAAPAPAAPERPRPHTLWKAFPMRPRASRPLPVPTKQPRRVASPRATASDDLDPMSFMLLVGAFGGAISLVLVAGRRVVRLVDARTLADRFGGADEVLRDAWSRIVLSVIAGAVTAAGIVLLIGLSTQ